MIEEILKELPDRSGTRKVIIVRRKDGRITYRSQRATASGWGLQTLDEGIYDSVDTAEMEARQRISWLKELFH